ncbi:MAG: ATP-binding protein [Acidobacteriota bacterium]
MPSLRVKLTVYYLAILAAVLLFFGIASYTILSRSLLAIIDNSLESQASAIERRMNSAMVEASTSEDHSTGNDQLTISPHLTQIITNGGVIADEMVVKPAYRLPVKVDELAQVPWGQTKWDVIYLETGEPFRVAIRRARDADGDTYFIRLGESLEPLSKLRGRILLVLSIAIPAALLLGSYGGLLLANQALMPVDRITRAARRIGAGDLSERVPIPPVMDEIGRLATTFNHMIARLEAAFERQRQFTSDASHELRTPLAVIRGDIEITLRRERSPEEYQRALTSSLEEIIRLSRLVEDLLTLARADAGRTQLRCEEISLDQLCQKMIDYISPLSAQRDQTLTYVAPAEDVVISGDLQRLKQLLLNLLDNAIKYTEPDGTITLSLAKQKDQAVMTVKDTGRGIPAEDIPHIFERFFRRSRTTSDKSAAGFGLGLSIVKWIVDSHGGTIEAQAELGKGTTFTVRFPLTVSVKKPDAVHA